MIFVLKLLVIGNNDLAESNCQILIELNEPSLRNAVRISILYVKEGNCKPTLTKGSYHNSKPVKVGKPSHRGGGSRILPGFSQLRGWEVVFVRGGVKKHKITSHF